jgi:hypothetical protein
MEQTHFRTSLPEKISLIPHIFGIRNEEEPRYQVFFSDDDFEIRIYSPYLMAETYVNAPSYSEAVSTGFVRLANFIFTDNSEGIKMEMTAPVFSQQDDFGWKISFLIPSKFNLNTVPRPTDSRINFQHVPRRFVAVVKYTGANSLEKAEQNIQRLTKWVSKKTAYQIVSNPSIAQYDSPNTLPFLRRNEIHFDLKISPHLPIDHSYLTFGALD